MTTHKVIWTGAKSALEAGAVLLTELLWPPSQAVSLTRDDDARDDASASWRLEAYFEDRPDSAQLAALLAPLGLAGGAIDTLPDIDWVAHSLAGLGVVRAGRFVLYGIHDADKLPLGEELIPIRIDANQAFGTGHHPTTAGCLTLLDRLAGMAPRRILDLGTGSAVLAIAAAKLWRRPVLATDVDRKSAEIARENTMQNQAADWIDVLVADGFSHEAVAAAAPFDFVFANILAGPLVEFAPMMARHVDVGGRVMLAGLMADQEGGVVSAYESAGFRHLNRLDHPVWPVLLFVRI